MRFVRTWQAWFYGGGGLLGVVLCVVLFALRPREEVFVFPFKEEDRCGLMDQHGRVRVKPEYISIFKSDEGYFYGQKYLSEVDRFLKVRNGGIMKYVIWDSSGRERNSFIVDYETDISEISEGYVIFYTKGGSMIRPIRGRKKVLTEYIGLGGFSCGLSSAGDPNTDKGGFINPKGDVVIPFVYDSLCSFRDGVATVAIEKEGTDYYGLIDTNGNVIVDTKYDLVFDASEGRCAVWHEGDCFYINLRGEEVLRVPYGQCSSFVEGLAAVKKANHHGYIDSSGALVIPLQFEEAQDFREGLAAVKHRGKWGYINREGEWVIVARFDDARDFDHGIAEVREGSQNGYINRKGEYLWRE